MLSKLTNRQRAVLRSLLKDKSVEEIANEFGISPKTARRHMVAVLRHLGLYFPKRRRRII